MHSNNIIDEYAKKWNFKIVKKLNGGEIDLVYLVQQNNKTLVFKYSKNKTFIYQIEALKTKNTIFPKTYMNDKNAILMEYLGNTSLANIKIANEKKIDIIFSLIKKVKDIDVSKLQLNSFNDFITNYLGFKKNYDKKYKKFIDIANNYLKICLLDKGKLQMIHGDCHCDNVIYNSSKYYLIDPSGYLGKFEIDLAIIIRSFRNTTKNNIIKNLKYVSKISGCNIKILYYWSVIITTSTFLFSIKYLNKKLSNEFYEHMKILANININELSISK